MNSKEAIIQATIELINDTCESVDDITIRDICKRSGVGLGLVNYYFENKDRLIEVCVERIINEVVKKFDDIRQNTKDLSPFEKLDLLGNMTLSFLFEHYAVSNISILTDARAPKKTDNTNRTYLAFLPLVAECRPDWGPDKVGRITFYLIASMQQAFLRNDVVLKTQRIDLKNADERKAYYTQMLKDVLGGEYENSRD